MLSLQAEEKTQSATEDDYIRLYGWYIGKQAGVSEIGLSSKELQTLFAGFELAAQDKQPPEGSYNIAAEMQMFLQERVNNYQLEKEKQMAKESEKNTAQGHEFFAKLSKMPEIEESSTGLFYHIKNQGSEKKPTSSNEVVVHYEGKLIDGTIFDSSKRRGEPATFGVSQVIPGFKEGLQLLGEGGQATLYIPAELGYGNMDIPGIPAGSTLVFEIELLKVL